MEQITVRNLTFSYNGEAALALSDISFEVEPGEILLLIGESGCGKTTLLRQLKSDLAPHGNLTGEVLFYGQPLREMSSRMQCAKIGFVQQNVEAAQVVDKVWHELAFGLESLGYPQEIMQRKVAEMAAFFGLEDIYEASLDALSGGQKQMVNLASVMVMNPEILVLDEPTSQLDPISAGDFFQMLTKINREFGTTIIMTEHRLEEAFSLCDRVLVLEKGELLLSGTPEYVAGQLFKEKKRMYAAMPTAVRLFLELEEGNASDAKMDDESKKQMQETLYRDSSCIPLNVKDGSVWFGEFCESHGVEKRLDEEKRLGEEKKPGEKKREGQESIRPAASAILKKWKKKEKQQDVVLSAEELWFRYEKKGRDILKGCSISLEKGKVTALLGGNGAGKSTLLHVLAGHEKAYVKNRCCEDEQESGKNGRNEKNGYRKCRIGMLPQNPQAMFAKKTVLEELTQSAGRKDETIRKMIERFGLERLLNRHPFDLSGGEMQKLALAKLVLSDCEILLLDEPGKGMDYAAKEKMGTMLLELAKDGKTILMVSHDVEFCARFAHRCGLFFDGHVVSMEDTCHFFCQNVFYTTAARRMCKNYIPEAVVRNQVIDYFGYPHFEEKLRVEVKYFNEEKGENAGCIDNMDGGGKEAEYSEKLTESGKDTEIRKHKWLSFAVFFLLMPATIYVGEVFLHQRKYYFISLLLLLEAIGSFLLSFERKKPKIREIMVVATLCAITVAGRVAFYMVPAVKPMAALVIISGISLGGEIGFVVGAFSMLVSNIFFGQGPWTPWQIFAMGILGFFAGIIFQQDSPLTKKKITGICIFGFLSVVILYGGIMNPASVILYQDTITVEMLMTAYGMGFPFDLVHGGSTVLFLLLGAKPLLEKLDRVKKKYWN